MKALQLLFVIQLLSRRSNLVTSITVYESTAALNSPKPLAGLQLAGRTQQLNLQDGLSLCARFNFLKLSKNSKLFQLQSLKWLFLYMSIGYDSSFFQFGVPNYDTPGSASSWILKDLKRDSFLLWFAFRWHHVCISYDMKTSYISVVKDGEATNVNFVAREVENVTIPSDLLQSFYIGRCPDGAKFDDCSRHAGQFTDINVWSKPLSVEVMKQWTTCKLDLAGDLVDWTSAEWTLTNMTPIEVTKTSICQPQIVGPILLPEVQNMSSTLALCQKLQGNLMVVDSNETQVQLANMVSQSPKCVNTQGRLWGGWWDQLIEGIYENVNDRSDILTKDKFQIWGVGQPNGDTKENCVVLWKEIGWRWSDLNCGLKACGVCNIDNIPPTFYLRGLCPGSMFDGLYGWTGEILDDGEEKFTFRGFTSSFLFWDSSKEYWKLTLYSDSNVYTFCNSTGDSYPFGTQTWYIVNDTCQTINKEDAVDEGIFRSTLSFSSCDENKFNCKDGTCTDLSKRCDGRMDCLDKSDEVDCEKIIFDSAYFKAYPALPLETSGFTKLQLHLLVEVTSILDLDEVQSRIELQFKMVLQWIDPRLRYKNLNSNDNLNSLTPNEKDQLWLPILVFSNTKFKTLASFHDPTSYVTVSIRDGIKRQKASLMSSINTDHYRGSDSTLAASKHFTIDFICNFQMAWYPFDTQVCLATIDLKSKDWDFVDLVEQNVQYDGPVEVLQYVLLNVTFAESGNHTANLKFTLGRRLLSEILTTIVPSILIVLVSFTTNYYGNVHFEAAVGVNLTAFLVLATLYISVSKGLPKTSYLKMVDVWLIFAMAIPFAVVVMQTRINYLVRQTEDLTPLLNEGQWAIPSESKSLATKKTRPKILIQIEKSIRIMTKVATILLPLLYVVFTVSFFIVGFFFAPGVIVN